MSESYKLEIKAMLRDEVSKPLGAMAKSLKAVSKLSVGGARGLGMGGMKLGLTGLSLGFRGLMGTGKMALGALRIGFSALTTVAGVAFSAVKFGASLALKGIGMLATGLWGVTKLLGKISLVGAATFTGIAALGVRAWMKQEDAVGKLAAVLKATGGAAGYSTAQLAKFAGALQKTTKFGDETTMEMMAVLATFKEIKGPTFKEATATILDMSEVLGQDLKSSAIQVGKALNDPAKGVTALQRVGVSFTAQQREQIKTLVESGKVMQAQKIILAELASEFGGSASAAAKTLGGRFVQLKNVFGDVLEKIGELTDDLFGLKGQFGGLTTAGEKIIGWLDQIKSSQAFQSLTAGVQGFMSGAADRFRGWVKNVVGFVSRIDFSATVAKWSGAIGRWKTTAISAFGEWKNKSIDFAADVSVALLDVGSNLMKGFEGMLPKLAIKLQGLAGTINALWKLAKPLTDIGIHARREVKLSQSNAATSKVETMAGVERQRMGMSGERRETSARYAEHYGGSQGAESAKYMRMGDAEFAATFKAASSKAEQLGGELNQLRREIAGGHKPLIDVNAEWLKLEVDTSSYGEELKRGKADIRKWAKEAKAGENPLETMGKGITGWLKGAGKAAADALKNTLVLKPAGAGGGPAAADPEAAVEAAVEAGAEKGIKNAKQSMRDGAKEGVKEGLGGTGGGTGGGSTGGAGGSAPTPQRRGGIGAFQLRAMGRLGSPRAPQTATEGVPADGAAPVDGAEPAEPRRRGTFKKTPEYKKQRWAEDRARKARKKAEGDANVERQRKRREAEDLARKEGRPTEAYLDRHRQRPGTEAEKEGAQKIDDRAAIDQLIKGPPAAETQKETPATEEPALDMAGVLAETEKQAPVLDKVVETFEAWKAAVAANTARLNKLTTPAPSI